MLARAGAIATRPEDLAEESGLRGGGYRLSEVQAQAILDLRLHRLTGLEQDKIIAANTASCSTIFRTSSRSFERPSSCLQVIRDELAEIREQYGDERRTEIVEDYSRPHDRGPDPPRSVVVTLSHGGLREGAAGRASTGRSAAAAAASRGDDVKDEDFVEKLFVANTHDTLLCFSNRGKVYWLKVYQLPQAGRGSRGRPIVNLLPLEEGERITAVLPIREFEDDQYVFMATRHGTVKKTPLAAFSRPRTDRHHRASTSRTDDRLVGVGHHGRHARRHAVRELAARRSASPRTTCGRWAARRPACAASELAGQATR